MDIYLEIDIVALCFRVQSPDYFFYFYQIIDKGVGDRKLEFKDGKDVYIIEMPFEHTYDFLEY